MKKIKKPLVSVLMPVYNNMRYVTEAVESVMGQTFKDFELLMVDDASTDSTWEVIQNLRKRYPKQIKAFQLKINSGAFRAANHALKFAKGDFIAVMDSDDISAPGRFMKQLEFLRNNQEVVVVGSQVRLIDENGLALGVKRLPVDHKQIYKDFGIVHPMVHPSCMIRRSVLEDKKILYKIGFGVNDDYYTLFDLLTKGKFANLDEYLLSYRIHMKNSSLSHLKEKFFNTVRIRFLARKQFAYRLSFKALFLMGVQTGIVLCIPERYLFKVYLFCRGINKPIILFTPLIFGFRTSVVKPAKNLVLLHQEV